MIRLTNIALAVTLIVLIAALYHIRYSAEAEAKAVAKIEQRIARERDVQRTLQAEWASLNDPRRLQTLSRQYLDLDYLRASQVLDLRDDTPRSIPIVLTPIKGGLDEPQ